MNLDNLKIMHDYLLDNRETIEPFFNIGLFRQGDKRVHKCDSIGCVLGHGVGAFAYEDIPKDDKDCINFHMFSKNVLGISTIRISWDFLFSGAWNRSEKFRSFDAAMSRLKWISEGKYYRDHEQYLTFKEIT